MFLSTANDISHIHLVYFTIIIIMSSRTKYIMFSQAEKRIRNSYRFGQFQDHGSQTVNIRVIPWIHSTQGCCQCKSVYIFCGTFLKENILQNEDHTSTFHICQLAYFASKQLTGNAGPSEHSEAHIQCKICGDV